MKRFLFVVLFAILASCSSERFQRSSLVYYLGSASTSVAGDAAEASRIFTISDRSTIDNPTSSWKYVNLFFELTVHAESTIDDIQLFCWASNDGGTTLFTPQAESESTGVWTLVDEYHKKVATASATFSHKLDMSKYPGGATCRLDMTQGEADDNIKVSGVFSAD